MTASPAGRFADKAEALGWVVVRQRTPTTRGVQASNGNEAFTLIWEKNEAGNWQFARGQHHLGAIGNVEPWTNVAAALRIMAEPGHIVLGPDNVWRRLPFHPNDSTDEEILAAVRGRQITWMSSFSSHLLVARVPHISRHTHIEYAADLSNARTLSFVDSGGGFRSVRLAAIVEVKQ